jgi:glycosyltransferase involved in cell wall biosynthesis
MKRRLAIFMHGGISGGIESQGFPKIVQIVEGLSDHFDVRVYSLWPVEKKYPQKKYQVYSPPPALRIKFFRWVYFVAIIIIQHIRKKHHVFYSFWAFPVGFVVVLLGILFNVPSCVSVLGAETANLPEINYGHLRNPFVRELVIWTCQRADFFVAVSPYQVAILERYGLKRKGVVIPFGVDSKYFYPNFKKLEAPLKILHVANLTEVKDQETLIRSFQVVRKQLDAKLRIVGPDFLKGKIHALVKQLNLQDDIEFVPPVLHQHLITHFHWADAFILTSLSEGQNNSITEAMMCGLLPVSTAVGSMDWSFGVAVGVIANCRDYETLGNKLVELYNRPDEWERKRKAAFEWANTHDLNWTIAQLRTLLSK